MLIKCPYCGPRDLAEFSVAGEARERPKLVSDFDCPEAQTLFVDAVYFRDNPAGLHAEHWFHTAGCQSWLVVERDTLTHAFANVKLARDEERSL
jgi:methylglutamate dehydrogenase subunit B